MGGFRPPQWAQSGAPQLVMITFPGQGGAPQYASGLGITATLPSGKTIYVFDVVIRAQHEQRLVRTRHPVQTGASISDHAYLEPARLTLDIGMSDVMSAYNANWAGNQSKSVSAYQTLLALQYSRVPLQITTKLRTYFNMIIENPGAQETYKTFAGLRSVIEFGQIFVAKTNTVTDSARPQDTNSTTLGGITPQPPTAAQQQQDFTGTGTGVVPSNAIGAGNWSSINKINLAGLPPAK
jgi:hypothetical protein